MSLTATKRQVGWRGNADEGRKGKTERFKKKMAGEGDGREKETAKKTTPDDELLGETEEAKEGER